MEGKTLYTIIDSEEKDPIMANGLQANDFGFIKVFLLRENANKLSELFIQNGNDWDLLSIDHFGIDGQIKFSNNQPIIGCNLFEIHQNLIPPKFIYLKNKNGFS